MYNILHPTYKQPYLCFPLAALEPQGLSPLQWRLGRFSAVGFGQNSGSYIIKKSSFRDLLDLLR